MKLLSMRNDTWIHIMYEILHTSESDPDASHVSVHRFTVPEVGVEGEGPRSSQGITVPVNWPHTQSRSSQN